MTSPNDYPDAVYELGLAHEDLDTQLTLRCGCVVWADSAPHDEEDCMEAAADWAFEQEALRNVACHGTTSACEVS